MPTTFRCPTCGAISQITCPDCYNPHLEVVGPIELYLPILKIFVSIDTDETNRYLRVKKPTGETLIPLQEKDKSNDDPL